MRWGAAGLALALAVTAAGSPAPDRRSVCKERLGELGRACLLYAEQHDGKIPESLGDLFYEAYVTDLEAFVCPAHPIAIPSRDHIDLHSGYALVPRGEGAEPRVVLADASPENHGGAGVHEFLSDGSVRWRKIEGETPDSPSETEVFAPLGHHVWLGVRVKQEEEGVRVQGVQSGGIAARWGLATGDVISAFRGRGVSGDNALTKAVGSCEPGERVPLLVVRDGAPVVLTAVVGDLPDLIAGGTAKARETGLRLRKIEVGPSFATSADRIACIIGYEDAPDDTHLVVDWLRDGMVVARAVAGIEGRGKVTATVYDLEAKGFPPGDYRVRAASGGMETTARFVVE